MFVEIAVSCRSHDPVARLRCNTLPRDDEETEQGSNDSEIEPNKLLTTEEIEVEIARIAHTHCPREDTIQ